jgi:hypothetical protein
MHQIENEKREMPFASTLTLLRVQNECVLVQRPFHLQSSAAQVGSDDKGVKDRKTPLHNMTCAHADGN